MSDKTPIEPSANYGGGFSLGQISCKMREMLIAIGLVVIIVMSLVFVALYSTAAKSGGDTRNGGVTAAQHLATTPTPDPRTCNTPGCLQAVGYARWLMNVSIDPCEDFYTYACGQWPDRYPLKPDSYRSSVTANIFENNQKKLLGVLSTDVKRDMPWAAERKAKDLYMSCMDDYGRMVVGGNALISKVLNKIGGWALVHDLPDDWNILNAVEKVHVDFWTDVLFNVYVGSDYTYGYRYRIPIITISSGGLGMGYYNYYLRSYYSKTRTDYQAYMRNVAKLLLRDGGISPGADFDRRVNTFVVDVWNFEMDLANITSSSRYSYSRTGQRSLATLNNQTGNMVDWVSFMKYLFDKATITENTVVNVRRSGYLEKIAQMITDLPETNRSRILNNYFVWQIAVKYAKDLSYEYIHARKQYYKDRYGAREFQSPDSYCFNYIKRNMPDALSHIFIMDHFADKNKKKVTEIASYVKQAIIDGVDQMDFMDKDTKAYAKKKLSYTYDSIGYPDWLMDSDAVDLIYYPLNITKGDYFQNVLNVNMYDKVDMNNRYLQIGGEDHLSWHGNTYNSYMYLYQTWNELIAPAGLLQSPLYDYHSPHYTNFGAIGSMFGNRYLDAIDRTGSIYGYHGERLMDPRFRFRYKRWWSNSTTYNFTNATACFANFYVNKTAGSYIDEDGNVVDVPVSTYSAKSYSQTAAQEMGGVKRAYYAYQAWQKKSSREKLPPILDLNNEQMFFISYAQTKCTVTRRYSTSPLFSRYFPIPDSMKVNGAMAMMTEFSQAFGCSADSALNPSDKCSVF